MRRNLRLTLFLLLLSGLYIFMLLSINGSSTLQNNAHYSVSGLTHHFSVFVPTSSKTRSAIEIAKVRRKIHPRLARNLNLGIRSKAKVKDRPKGRKRPRKQRYLSLEKRGKEGGRKTLDKRLKLRTRSVIRSSPNAGSGQELQNISKAEVHKEISGNSYVSDENSRSIPILKSLVMTPPNYLEGSRLHNNRDMDTATPTIQTKLKRQFHASVRTFSDVRVVPKTKILPMQIHKQVTFHEKPESRIQNMSAGFRNGDGKVRSATQNTSGVRVIIVAHGRSGSSFFGGIFNAHPDFFFMYEPLNQLKKIVNQNTDDYLDSAEYVVNAILKCNFEDDGFLEIMSRAGHHRASCRPLVSPPFCNTTHERAINFVANQNWKLCNGSISADVLNKICRKHVNIASKILLESLEPADLSWILGISGSYPTSPSFLGFQSTVHARKNPKNEVEPVYVLYLVRDPRAMIYSRYSLGWLVPRVRNEYAMESGEADEMVREVCDRTELNLGAVLRHPHRIKLIRYEDLATNPKGIVRDLFSELRISPSKEVFRWIYSKTHGPVNLAAVSLSRNANMSINAWREKIPPKLLEIVETRCERIMKYLGYLPTNGSGKMLRNLRKPLYLNKIRDLKESYQWPAM